MGQAEIVSLSPTRDPNLKVERGRVCGFYTCSRGHTHAQVVPALALLPVSSEQECWGGLPRSEITSLSGGRWFETREA